MMPHNPHFTLVPRPAEPTVLEERARRLCRRLGIAPSAVQVDAIMETLMQVDRHARIDAMRGHEL